MAATLNLTGADRVSKNFDLVLEIRWMENSTTPKNLTGWLIRFIVSSFGNAKLTASTANGRITVPDPTNGKAFVRLPAGVLADLPNGTHRYYCVATKDGNTEALIEESPFEIA